MLCYVIVTGAQPARFVASGKATTGSRQPKCNCTADIEMEQVISDESDSIESLDYDRTSRTLTSLPHSSLQVHIWRVWHPFRSAACYHLLAKQGD